jgi:hypothetical protein
MYTLKEDMRLNYINGTADPIHTGMRNKKDKSWLVYCLFNDTLSISRYTGSKWRLINEYCIRKVVKKMVVA